MPPKKKANKNTPGDEPVPAEARKVEKAPLEQKNQDDKPQIKANPEPVESQSSKPVQSLPSDKKERPAAKEGEPKEAPKEMNSLQKAQKVMFESIEKLNDKEKIELRKLRFGGGVTVATVEEAEKIKEERRKKFGAAGEREDGATIDKRKEKFGGPVVAKEDEEAVKRRKEKFGGGMEVEQKEVLESRAKKFGNSEGDVNPDDQIKKNKGIKKHKPKFNNRPGWNNRR